MTEYLDSETLAGVTTPSSVELKAKWYVESQTLPTVTVFSGTDVGPFTDASTVTTTTDASSYIEEFTHPSGSWGIFDTEDGEIHATVVIDAMTVSGRTVLTGVEEYTPA